MDWNNEPDEYRKVVILAGGLGTRLSEETDVRPKADGGDRRTTYNLAYHEDIFELLGCTDFVICLGYKGYVIKEFFANYHLHIGGCYISIFAKTLTMFTRSAQSRGASHWSIPATAP